jgi:hypothetical protein
MRDPEVVRQSDLQPYPFGPAKIVFTFQLSIRFDRTKENAPIEWKLRTIASTMGHTVESIDQYGAEDEWKPFPGNPTYNGQDVSGTTVLDNAGIPDDFVNPVYDPAANPFPDPAKAYLPFRIIRENGRWFCARFSIKAGDCPTLSVSCDQQAAAEFHLCY